MEKIITYALIGAGVGLCEGQTKNFFERRKKQRKEAVDWTNREIDRLSTLESIETRFLQLFEMALLMKIEDPPGIVLASECFSNVLGAYQDYTKKIILPHTAHAIAQQNLVRGMQALEEGCTDLSRASSKVSEITNIKSDLKKNIFHIVSILTARACS
jgi:hypothetical protein